MFKHLMLLYVLVVKFPDQKVFSFKIHYYKNLI